MRIQSGLTNVRGLGRTLGQVGGIRGLAQFPSFKMQGINRAIGSDLSGVMRSSRTQSATNSPLQAGTGLLGYLRRYGK